MPLPRFFLLPLLAATIVLPALAQQASENADIPTRLDKIEERLSSLERYLYSQTVSADAAKNNDLLKRIEAQLNALQTLVIDVKTTSAPTVPASMDKEAQKPFSKNEPEHIIITEDDVKAVTQKETTLTAEGASAAEPADPTVVQAEYDAAFEQLKEKQYDAAITLFIAFIKQHDGNQLAENAYYWLAESYYAKGEYQQAAVEFLKAYQTHPAGAKSADNLLKLALSLAEIDKRTEACGTLDKLSEEFPDAPPAIKKRRNEEYSKLDCS